jgi:hypothetical protein
MMRVASTAREVTNAFQATGLPAIGDTALRAVRLAAYVKPEHLRAVAQATEGLQEALRNSLGAVPDPEMTRRVFEVIRRTGRFEMSVSAAGLAAVAEAASAAARDLPEDAGLELEETATELRELIDELEPQQRRVLGERLAAVILAVAVHVQKLLTEESPGALLPTLGALLFTLLILYNAVMNTIDDVERKRSGTE